MKSPEDAYVYLSCIKKGFIFNFAGKASVQFRSPSTFGDFSKQSVRFEKGKKNLEEYFSKGFIEKNYKIPLNIFILSVILFLIKNPIYAICYIAIKLYLFCFKKTQKINFSTWEIAYTSKKLF